MMFKIKQDIIEAAQAAQKAMGVLASISLAQYGLESGWGARMTGTNNPFGIKAVQGQPYQLCPTHEFINGKYIAVMARFASYQSIADAFIEHAKLLASHPQYNAFMLADKTGNVEAAVNALTGVYATAPNYGPILWHIIQGGNLTQYDKV
jgi:flagellum-specific peptidoglycan hydrolase FlgJ